MPISNKPLVPIVCRTVRVRQSNKVAAGAGKGVLYYVRYRMVGSGPGGLVRFRCVAMLGGVGGGGVR